MSDAALLVIDVQESFRHAPYWSDEDVAPFAERLQALIDGAVARGMPVLQVFHTAPAGHFSLASGHVRTLEPVAVRPDAVFHKGKHSALVGTGLDVWLTQHGIRRLLVSGIRTEQCCETTTRHASDCRLCSTLAPIVRARRRGGTARDVGTRPIAGSG